MLEAMVLNKGTQPQLLVYQNEGTQIGSSVVDSILTTVPRAVYFTNLFRSKWN